MSYVALGILWTKLQCFTHIKASKHFEMRAADQTPLALKASEIKENNAISHLTDDNIILYPLLPSDTLDQ